MHKERITLEDNGLTILTKLSEGNPGALIAMMEMMRVAEEVDPDSMFKKLSPLIGLDVEGIYASSIHLLYKDCCQSNPARAIGLLRACQMGVMDRKELTNAVDPSGIGKPLTFAYVNEVIKGLKEVLPNFDPENKAGV